MKIKKALEEYYKRVRGPQALEGEVLRRIEREKAKRWKKLALVEGSLILVFLVTASFISLFFKGTQYETMSAQERERVEFVQDVSLLTLSEDLLRASLKIEGPLGEREFYLIGERDKLERFLEEKPYVQRKSFHLQTSR